MKVTTGLSAVARVLMLLLALAGSERCTSAALPDPNQGPGGPILVITSPSSTYGKYYAEILRTEGLNEFAVADIGTVTSTTLSAYDLVVLAPATLTAAQVSMFTSWVNAGGNLIAMRPDPQLATLLGLTAAGSTLSNGYLLVDTSTPPGNGIVSQPMQFHGTADAYTLSGASKIATLYPNPTTASPNPAVTLRTVGTSGGHAAAFSYDLATSVVYTRQGNPAWAAQERDGSTPIRSDDKFYGAATGDPQPDWADLNNEVSVPQADEQQRLLANLILQMNLVKKPLPRFWYFPRGKKAVVVMTGDDHGNGGSAGRFDQYLAASPAGCSVANWECVRSTSYIYVETQNLTNAQAASYTSQGFEVALHINTNCADFTPTSLDTTYSQQLSDFTNAYPSIPAPMTQRHHCIVWSDWVTGAKTELKYGMRFDASYYFWPPGWVQDRPGHFTGSAMPMRFADLNGTLIDVYNAPSQMTDESGQTYPFTSDALLSAALGPQGYYGVYTVNAHTDTASNPVSDAVLSSAQSRGVPIVSSLQLLNWLDSRNSSSFSGFGWSGNTLTFSISPAGGATGLQGMLPTHSNAGMLAGITGPSGPVALAIDTIKGVEYAFFSAATGTYTATYTADTTSPTVTSTSPATGATGVTQGIAVSATFSEAIDPSTINSSSFVLRDPSSTAVPAAVGYTAATHTATLTPNSSLVAGTTYTASITTAVKDLSGNALLANYSWSFTTAAAPPCPCSAWSSSATPGTASVNDPNAVELGVKFTVDLNGFITGVRFYKGSTNTGTHVGNLWSSAGQLLATASVVNETATGWQQVNFSSPVAVTANTVYVASYHTNAGNYAANNSYFATAGVDNSPIHLLRDGVSGGDGVYIYGASSRFPTNTYQSTNYWVDVVFTVATGATALSVTSTTPATGATGVSTSASVSATFSSSLNTSTINSSTFTLKDASNTQVAASYSGNGNLATLTPSSPLAGSTTYTATLTTGVKDINGNALSANYVWSFTTATVSTTCTSPPNAIVAENCLAGNPASEWDISGAGDSTIQGFATDISVNQGSTVTFKINTTAAAYRLDIYRMGYYGGSGARKVTSISASGPQNQPACLSDSATGLLDCGNWTISASWTVPANATSGIYFAKAVRTDTGGASHIVFIVRNDTSHSDLLFQTSDLSWQAYNDYGGKNLYGCNGVFDLTCRAYKVSYNRPFHTRVFEAETWVFNAEYPMVRWLEANGYDVTYFSGVDTERNAALIRNHKVWMSNGHDEYWPAGQRASVQAARDAGVHLAFFSGNTMFWKTRWENSTDGSNTPYRTLVCYKETHANAVIDPADPPTWTGTWRDPRFSPPADGGQPENALVGTLFRMNGGQNGTITVPQADGRMRFWRNTPVATLGTGQVATLAPGTIGAEFDDDEDNGFRPAGLFELSSTSITDSANYLLDYGTNYGAGTAIHKLTLYKAPSKAWVFAAGTYQWAWGLDSNHDRSNLGSTTDLRMQQATVNLFADMGVQPFSLQAGLAAAVASSDATAPGSTITAPTAGSNLPPGRALTITGTATDAGGGVVAAVEVSVDSGITWHPATGQGSWSYSWTPAASGSVTIKSRAVDDSGNLESPTAGVTVTVGWTVSGTITGTTGVTVALSGAATATATTDTSGNYSFPGLVNGSYTVTPSKAGFTFNPSSAPVTVNGANVGGINFVATATSSWSISGTITGATGVTVALSGAATATATTDSSGNYSFPGLVNGSYTVTPTKAGFTFNPTSTPVTVNGANVGGINFVATATSSWSISGTITGATGVTVALSGAATATATTDASGNYSFPGLLNGSYTVTPTKAGFTFNPTSTPVTVNGANVGGINFVATAISSWSISGTITGTTGVTVALSGAATATATTDSSGNYSFPGLLNGSYTVTPTKAGFTFNPTSTPVTVNGANVGGINFVATAISSWSISGTITGTTGVTVALSGAATATATTDSSGNYTFSGLQNGSYTVTPTKAGFNFSPVSAAVTVNSASVAGINFASTTTLTWSISGAVTGTTGVTVTLSGGATATATTDTSGAYSFAGLLNGTYNVSPSKTGFSFTPANQAVTVNGANVTGVTFAAKPAIAIDAKVFADQGTASTAVKTPVFSTTAGSELLLAVVSADWKSGSNTTVSGITGAGLTWELVRRTNAQRGTAEIWRAFAASPLNAVTVTATFSRSIVSSMTVMTFTGVDPSGINGSGAIGATGTGNGSSGAPTASLVTTRDNSWVFGVGNDFDKAIARTPGPGQSLVHQYLAPVGDTYWVQMQNSPTPTSGTVVIINDTAPTTDRYNLTICEVLPAP